MEVRSGFAGRLEQLALLEATSPRFEVPDVGDSCWFVVVAKLVIRDSSRSSSTAVGFLRCSSRQRRGGNRRPN